MSAERSRSDPVKAPASITELRLLECFVALAEELHVARAAQRLGIGPSALGRSVAQLERRLGVELLIPGGGEVRLTPTGDAMLARSVELLGRHEALVQEIRRLGRQHPTSIAVAVDDAFAGLLLAAAIQEYRAIARDAEVGVRSSPHGAGAAQLLSDGSVDFALVGLQPVDPGARSVVVGSCRPVLLASAEHPLADADLISLEELRGEPELRARGACKEARAQWSIGGLLGEPPVIAGEFGLFAEALDLVAAGQGVMLAPDLAQRRFARADLRWIPLAGMDSRTVHLAWRRRNVPRSQAEALVSAFERAGAGAGAEPSVSGLEEADDGQEQIGAAAATAAC